MLDCLISYVQNTDVPNMTLGGRMHSFVPADKAQFSQTHPSFASTIDGMPFDSWGALNTPEAFTKMKVATEDLELPALAGILKSVSQYILGAPAEKQDAIKRAYGALVCVIMEANGYRKTGIKKAVPPIPVRIFSKAEFYELA